MVLKNMFDPAVKQEIIGRINKLSPDSKPLWGKMTVGQMMAHLQMPIGSAEGVYKLKRTFMGRIFGPLAKSTTYSEKPYRRNLPTDPSFVMAGTEKDFETEKGKLIGLINNFTEASITNETHPFFGHMTREQWSMGTWKHLDHHLQQFGV